MNKIDLNQYPPLKYRFENTNDLDMLKSEQKYLNDLKVGDQVYVLRKFKENQLHHFYTSKITRFEDNNILLERWAGRFSCETYENNVNTQLFPVNNITTLILERHSTAYNLLINIANEILYNMNKIVLPLEEVQKFHKLIQEEIKKVKKNENK